MRRFCTGFCRLDPRTVLLHTELNCARAEEKQTPSGIRAGVRCSSDGRYSRGYRGDGIGLRAILAGPGDGASTAWSLARSRRHSGNSRGWLIPTTRGACATGSARSTNRRTCIGLFSSATALWNRALRRNRYWPWYSRNSTRRRSIWRPSTLGVSATGPREYFYRLRDVAMRLRPDALLVFVYSGNDFLQGGQAFPGSLRLVDTSPGGSLSRRSCRVPTGCWPTGSAFHRFSARPSRPSRRGGTAVRHRQWAARAAPATSGRIRASGCSRRVPMKRWLRSSGVEMALISTSPNLPPRATRSICWIGCCAS